MDKVLKQRLVGASILIALAVIFLPMLFDHGSEESVGQRELAFELPERESGDRRVRRLALDPDQARKPSNESQAEAPGELPSESSTREEESGTEPGQRQADESSRDQRPEAGPRSRDSAQEDVEGAGREAVPITDDESAGKEPAPENIEAAESEVESAGAQPPDEPEPGPPSESEPEPGSTPGAAFEEGWVVQVAVFSNRETANSIRQRLHDLGHRVSMDVLIRDQAELFRLRTGPYEDEAAAHQARDQIATTVAGVQPVTRELSREGSTEDRHGLVVQVGSFASRNNAERLVGQLTDAGFDAFMYGEESGGRTIWRVRVGAYEERAEAERLLETLRAEQGLEGIVVSHP